MHSLSFTVRRFAAHILRAAAMVAVACLATACGGGHDDTAQQGALLTLTRSIGGQPGSLDPQRAEDAFSYDVLRDLYEGLAASTPDGAVIPAAATSWRVENDGKRYVFQLRDEARWSNGDPVTAHDFVEGFRRAVDPQTASGAADLLRTIENAPAILAGKLPRSALGVQALSDTSLAIELSRAVPYFPDILTNVVAFPVHRSSLGGQGGFGKPGVTVSNGPYRLAAYAPGANLVLLRNPHYWDAGSVAFDRVRYEVVADENAEYARFRAGELDVTNNVPVQRFQELNSKPGSGLQHRTTLATFYFTLNTSRGPLSASRGLREALSLAIDRDAIARSVARAGQVPAYSLVPGDTWNYVPPAYDWRTASREARLERARRLYKAAGYTRDQPLRLKLLYNENELIQRVCIAVAAMWQEALGVETELLQMEFKAYLASRADPVQWDVVRVGWTADYNDASSFLDTMTEGSPQNFGRWVNREYTRLLDAAAVESDPVKRRDTLQQAESLMLGDYPLLPVYFYVTRRLVQPRVAAPALNPMFRTYSRNFRPAR
ncbi:MAG TPA: peptide ABC transporter substrate-binding protein [Steroidobacteraceae bacterium]|nr:peptide ABC transporter substrate-binding protein [Steroidobacteraceae bacterium]